MKEIKAEIKTYQFRRNKQTYFIDIITTAELREAWLYRDGYHKIGIFGESPQISTNETLLHYVIKHSLKYDIKFYEHEIEMLEDHFTK